MSLIDRFNKKTQQHSPNIEQIKELVSQPNYYNSDEEALNANTLGTIDNILADDEINTIFVNGARNIYIEKRGKVVKSRSSFRDDIQLENIINKYLNHCTLDIENQQYFEINHDKGINLLITIPPLSKKITISVKYYNDKFADIKILRENQVVSKEIALILSTLVSINVNILITGAKKTLKTTILSAMSKTLSDIQRGVLIDYLNEIDVEKNLCAYFDFSILKNEEKEKHLLEQLSYTKPNKIFINSPKDYILEDIFRLASKTKGIITTLDAKNFEQAKETIKDINSFDIIIECEKAENETGKIASISQITNGIKEEIFALNQERELVSTGLIPRFFEKIKDVNINQNIFDKEYIHTYQRIPLPDTNTAIEEEPAKKINPEVLKKFKKDFPAEEIELMQDNE